MNYRLRAAAVLVSLLPLATTSGVGADIVEQILVKVNGEIFTKTDLEARQVTALRSRGQQIDFSTPEGTEQLRQAVADITPQLIVEVVDEMLVVQRGKELGYTLNDEQFKGVIDNIKKENNLESDDQFQAALQQENMTLADLRRSLERQMIVSRVQQNEVMGKIGVTEEEARQYYESHKAEFTTPSSITLREILVAVPADARGLNVAADEAAKAKADQIRGRVAGGENFEKLAGELSDAASRANAGLIGPLSAEDLSTELRRAVEGLKAGEMTPVLRTARGYQIIKLESATPVEVLPFEQARQQIGERVFTGKRQEEFRRYLDRLRSQAIIEWKNPDVQKAYELGLKQRASQTPAA